MKDNYKYILILLFIMILAIFFFIHIDNKQIHKSCYDYTYKVSNDVGMMDIGLNDKAICTGNTQIEKSYLMHKQTIYFWLQWENDVPPETVMHDCLITTKRCE